jgi:hypothetical protein
MGRYYSGDIEGKFWFGVQSSDDASFVGGNQCEPNFIEYCFEAEDKGDIEAGISKCRKALGDYKQKFDAFFSANIGYDEKMLIAAGFPKKKVSELLRWQARLELGEKILKCVNDTGRCYFQAEL